MNVWLRFLSLGTLNILNILIKTCSKNLPRFRINGDFQENIKKEREIDVEILLKNPSFPENVKKGIRDWCWNSIGNHACHSSLKTDFKKSLSQFYQKKILSHFSCFSYYFSQKKPVKVKPGVFYLFNHSNGNKYQHETRFISLILANRVLWEL